jgi:hypothetical protein
MPVTYDVKAAIINESKTNIERYAARIVQVTRNTEEDYIKTFLLPTHPKNLAHQNSLKEDLESTRSPFLGITFLSYGVISFIHFTSTLKLFQLNQSDSVTFYFDKGDPLSFYFHSPKTIDGFTTKNVHPVKDQELETLENCNLEYWIATNREGKSMAGGFTFNEHNKQYKASKIGQRILRLMAKNILITKEELRQNEAC